jgi:hypothetical protein
MEYDVEVRRQVAAERVERLADDYARASARRRRRRRRARWLPLAAGLELADRAKRRAQRPQLEG